MKTTLAIFLVLLLSPSAAIAAVRINEIAWMGIEGTNGQFGEWIELYNDGTDSVDVAGWKLYSGNGSDVLFTLTKTIDADGSLVIERTTSSMADPLPSINDESGPFGGGGLSNSGENLILKDDSGRIIQSLNFSFGWPAGDAATKQTMQWNGSSWVTAIGTPKAPTGGGGNDEDPPDVLPPPTAKARSKKPAPVTPTVTITVPPYLISNITYKFSASILLKDGTTNPRRGIYKWNFGDGTAIEQKDKLNPVFHTYEFPGTYTVWFGYYESIFSKEPLLEETVKVVVFDAALSISIVKGKAVQIVNETDDEIDLSDWYIVSGGSTVQLPLKTLLSGGGTVTIPAASIGLVLSNSVTLVKPDGTEVPQVRNFPVVQKREESRETTLEVIPEEPEVKGEIISANDIFAQDKVPETNNRTKMYIFGAVAVTIIGLSILLERFMARQE